MHVTNSEPGSGLILFDNVVIPLTNMENGSVDIVFTDPPFELVGGG